MIKTVDHITVSEHFPVFIPDMIRTDIDFVPLFHKIRFIDELIFRFRYWGWARLDDYLTFEQANNTDVCASPLYAGKRPCYN